MAGGALIGLSASLLFLLNGRIAGISGILNGVLYAPKKDRAWRLFFLAGLALGAVLFHWLVPGFNSPRLGYPLGLLAAGGFLVGFGARMEFSVVAFAVFWPLLVLVQAAARQLDPRLLEVAAALQLAPAARFAKIVLPAMLPRLFVALRLGVAIALVVAVTVEIAANPHGMGYAIMLAQQSLDPALMLAWLFWIALVGFAVNALALWLQQRVARRIGAAA